MTNIIDRLRLAVKVYQRGMPAKYQQKNYPLAWPDFRVNQAQWHITDYASYIAEGFNMNTLIYSAIMYKAKALSSVPLRAYSGDIDQPEPLPESDTLAKLCARPNKSMSWREFQMLQEVWLNLAGNVFTYISPDRTEMTPLNPLRTYIIPGTKGSIKGYLYVPENTAMVDGIPLLAEDVSHVKLPNPGDPLDGEGYGLSPLSAMARSADVDNKITEFLKIFFDRGTMISGILKFSAPLQDRDIDRVRARWKEIYGGFENWDEIGVLDQGGEYQRLGYTFDEMGFETLDERNETRILGPFGVPPILIGSRIGLSRSTYSNYDQAYNAFWNDTMLHEAKLFEDDWQYYLSGDGKFVAYDFSDVPAFQQDVPAAVQSWRGLVEYGIPKNMAADITGLSIGDLPDGDVSYMPLSLVPIEQATAQREANTAAIARAGQQEEPQESEPENSEEDEREEQPVKGVKKKLPGHPHKNGRYGKNTRQLIGVGSAASRMAHKVRSTATSEKS